MLSQFKNILSDDLFNELDKLVTQVQSISNEYVGSKQSMAEVLLSNDSRVKDIVNQFQDWADTAIGYRLSRSNHRDKTPKKVIDRIIVDLVKPLETIAFKPKTANNCFMADLCDYIPWKTMKLNFNELLKPKFDPKTIHTVIYSVAEDPEDQYYLQGLSSLYKWHQAEHLPFLLNKVKATLTNEDFNKPEAELYSILESLVSDIEEMRPFLLHNFKSENICIEIAPQVVLSFFFAIGHGSGLIIGAPDPKTLLADVHNRKAKLSFSLQADGALNLTHLPWITSKQITHQDKDTLRANVKIVSALHATLFALFEKIDVRGIAQKYKLKSQTQSDLEPTDEEFAALVQSISQSESERSDEQKTQDLEQYLPLQAPSTQQETTSEPNQPEPETPTFGKLQTLRLSSVLRILQQNLNCEVRQGKGSEIVIYRQGGHHFRLGHHKRNP
ncbi:MAG: hypothetical protein IPJ49_29250 [Candidatus Obscuribacter sp.]|nr:hypothetical protein [Candidatus Obscuribacter sp.]